MSFLKRLRKPVARFFKLIVKSPLPGGVGTSFLILSILLAISTTFYTHVEGWKVFDAFYFSVITISTVGFGDLAPTKTISKLFTIFLIFAGVGMVLYVLTTLAHSIVRGVRKKR